MSAEETEFESATDDDLSDIVMLDESELSLPDEFKELFGYFFKNVYEPAKDNPLSTEALRKCTEFFQRDYELLLIDNTNGALCANYPSTILIPQKERNRTTLHTNHQRFPEIGECISRGRLARSRTRFPVPVILIDGKFIVRSSTVVGLVELLPRTGFEYFQNYPRASTSEQQDVKISDVEYLKLLNANTIVDLMVEKQKTKYWLKLTSSEKIETDAIYKDFNICCLPYPGCEFFQEFYGENFDASSLKFDWEQSEIDVELTLPDNIPGNYLGITWNEYKDWKLIGLTQNYLKFILNRIKDGSDSILIHCISGWDRTPLFISLVRLSLWADGLIHKSLNVIEMLYFTLAYDWFLFGHNFPTRIRRKEHILFFCFYVLQYITDDEFKIKLPFSGTSSSSSDQEDKDKFDSSFSPELPPDNEPRQHVESDDPTEMDTLNKRVRYDEAASPITSPVSPKAESTDGGFVHVTSLGSTRSSESRSEGSFKQSTSKRLTKRKRLLISVRSIFFGNFYKEYSKNEDIATPKRSLLQNVSSAVEKTSDLLFGGNKNE